MRSADRDKRPRLLGIVGYPLERSGSPAIQNAALSHCDIPWVYAPLRVAPGRLKVALRAFAELDVVGFNVTVPHKEEILGHLSNVSAEAYRIGAVNTVWRTRQGWAGDNTDLYGFSESLRRARSLLRGESAVLFGAGGAARAVAYALIRHFEIGALLVVTRDSRRCSEFCHWAGGLDTRVPVSHASLRSVTHWTAPFRVARIVVNATPVGMTAEPERLLPSDLRFARGQIAYDLTYGRRTDFLTRAGRAGAVPVDGSAMLWLQAARAFTLWTGRHFPWRKVRAELGR